MKRRDLKGRFKQIYHDNLNINTSVKLPREYRKSCVLTDKDIEKIISLYPKKSSRILGKQFGVTKTAILYWVNGIEYRKKEAKRMRGRNGELKEAHRLRAKKYRMRLKTLIPNLSEKERVKVNKQRHKIF